MTPTTLDREARVRDLFLKLEECHKELGKIRMKLLAVPVPAGPFFGWTKEEGASLDEVMRLEEQEGWVLNEIRALQGQIDRLLARR